MPTSLSSLYSVPLDALPIVVFDLETTGLHPQHDAVCEIGAVRVQDGRLQEEYTTMVNPERQVTEDSTAIHHLTHQQLLTAPTLHEVLPDFLRFVGPAALAAHNANFDVSFLEASSQSWGIDLYHRPIFDTAFLARRLLPKQQSYALSSLAASYSLPSTSFHHALEDTRTTAHLLLLLFRYAKEQGIRTLADYESKFRYIGRSGDRKTLTPTEQELWSAIQHKLDVEIRYRKADGSSTTRTISPAWLSPPFVTAFCHLRQDMRSFRTDRIVRSTLLASTPTQKISS